MAKWLQKALVQHPISVAEIDRALVVVGYHILLRPNCIAFVKMLKNLLPVATKTKYGGPRLPNL